MNHPGDLDGNHCLIRERFEQFDLPIREGSNFHPPNVHSTDSDTVSQQRGYKRGPNRRKLLLESWHVGNRPKRREDHEREASHDRVLPGQQVQSELIDIHRAPISPEVGTDPK